MLSIWSSFVLQFYDFIFFLMSLAHVQGNTLDLVHDILMKNADILPWGTLLRSSLPYRNWGPFLKDCVSFWLMKHGYDKQKDPWILTKRYNSSLTVPTTLPNSEYTTGAACGPFPGVMSLQLQRQTKDPVSQRDKNVRFLALPGH